MNISARTEVTAIWGNDDGLNFVSVRKRAKPVAQFCIAVEGKGVLSFRPVKSHNCDFIFNRQ